MTGDSNVASLSGALRDLMEWLERERIPGVIIGGVAASLLGRPRMTRDVDAVILADDLGWEAVIDSAQAYHIGPRIEDPMAFARRTRMLLLRHLPSGVDLDVSLGALPFEREMIERASWIDVGPLRLRIPSVEDLVIMKALARRPRDLADIEAVLDVHPDMDLERVRRWLREFSAALEMPEIHDEFEQMLRRR